MTKAGKRFLGNPHFRIAGPAVFAFFLNLLYAFCHAVLGIANQSAWFLTICAYYIVLSAMRLSVVLCGRKSRDVLSCGTEYFAMKLCGALLLLLGLVLAGAVCISLSQNTAVRHGEIVMITIAAYTFYKITAAIVRAVKQRKNPSPLLSIIRSIGYAETAASALTLQRSMLVSFGGMADANIRIMNMLTGTVVCLFVSALGAALLFKGNRKEESSWQNIRSSKQTKKLPKKS